jgi:hypothetical protein
MPGQLRPDALCPICGYGLLVIVDTSSTGRLTRDYYHLKPVPGERRKHRCTRLFLGKKERDEATQERFFLETVTSNTRPN